MVIKSLFMKALQAGKEKAVRTARDGRTLAGFVQKDAKKRIDKYHAREVHENRLARTTFEIEKKGYKKLGVYKAGSKQLEWAVTRAKRDGLKPSGVTVSSDLGDYVVLFKKEASPRKAKSKTRAKTTSIQIRKVKLAGIHKTAPKKKRRCSY